MIFQKNECQSMDNAGLTRRRFLGLTLAGGVAVTATAGAVTKSVAQEGPENANAQYALIINTAKCVGCGLCVQACQLQNNLPEDLSYIRLVEQNDGAHTRFLHVQCQHCAEPPCATVCPTRATYIHESGAVLINEKLCVGCKYCVVACPYQARIYDEVRGVADKCNLCLERVLQGFLPACVQACPSGARVFGRTDDIKSEVSRILDAKVAAPLHPEFKTRPAVLAYIGIGED